MHMTPKDLKAAGCENLSVTYDQDRAEFTRRAKAGLPCRVPRFKVGDWTYSYILKRNVRVVSVYWDKGIPGCTPSFWRVDVPGHSAPDDHFWKEPNPAAPFVENVTDGYSWRPALFSGFAFLTTLKAV